MRADGNRFAQLLAEFRKKSFSTWKYMMLLGIDTATERASVALDDGLEINSEK
ncbi:MAG: hypothetical protein CM1200mP6_09820 [Anaerolineaceae bacterium]|nr:MAG: hypothetical protein CM1200mP6_09820 [Anaerolineaceae bacterium]